MSRKLDIKKVDAALQRAARRGFQGTREDRSGRFLPVQSSMMTSIAYDEDNAQLDITFTSGKTYRYLDVPLEIYVDLMEADSKGLFFNDNIKDEFAYSEARSP